jgi:lysozyme
MKFSTIVALAVAGAAVWLYYQNLDGSSGSEMITGATTYTGNLVQTEEGLSLTAYPDAGGYSIGYGHHDASVYAGETITVDQANQLLQQDIAKVVDAINQYVTVPLTQDQFNGLVDFIYNVGLGNFLNGTVLSKINSGDFAAAAATIEQYVKSGGQVLASLIPRRITDALGFTGSIS